MSLRSHSGASSAVAGPGADAPGPRGRAVASSSRRKVPCARTRVTRYFWGFAFLSLAAHADLDAGLRAFEAGDYATAFEILRPLATHHGYERAMNQLGAMYENGWGVERDGHRAATWYEKSALEGYSRAMYNLGLLYAEGKLIPRDTIKALAWLGAAGDHREPGALRAAKGLASTMTGDELVASGNLREQLNAHIYADTARARARTREPTLGAPPIAPDRLMSAQEILDLFSGRTSTHEFRESPMREHFKAHSSREHALAGRKAKFEGEYRDGYYKGKWWVERDMLCLDYARITAFDDCFWLERLNDVKVRTYSRKTGVRVIEHIDALPR